MTETAAPRLAAAILAASVVVCLLVQPLAARSSLSVAEVMRRVEAYVASYGEKAAIVVCTERYEQQASAPSDLEPLTRTLVSDFAIVRAGGSTAGWTGFRDVIEVDGRALPDRQDRLVRTLIGAEGRYDEAFRLQRESARYNIGILGRDFNIPTAALFFFAPRNHDRFRFKARGIAEDGTWEIEFREISTPTLIRTPEGESIPSSGMLWVKPATGIVVRTVLEADLSKARRRESGPGRVRMDVTFQHVAALDLWLPASMDERIEASRDGEKQTATGRAEYSNYRTFKTSGRVK